MHVLVTGSAGEFGRDLVPWLARRFNVRATDIIEADANCEFVPGDLRDPRQVVEVMEGIDAVIHLAALLPVQEYTTEDYMDVNVKATALVCEAAIEAGVERVIFASSIWAAGHGHHDRMPVAEDVVARPAEMYGLTKLQGEQAVEYYARKHGLSAVVMRLCGYWRCPEFAADGSVDLGNADLGVIAEYMMRPQQKLYNPNDLGRVMEAALTVDDVSLETVIIGTHVPWRAEDWEGLKAEPMRVIEGYYPGARELFEAYGIEPAPIHEFYSTERSRALLGFDHEYTLHDLIAAHKSRD